MKTTFKFFTALLLLSSCVKDKPLTEIQPAVEFSNDKKIYIVNEGNFMAGNSSVSLYDPGKTAVIKDFYNTQNSEAAGDVAQSLRFFNSKYYLVVNNSSKIIVCDHNFKKSAVISGFNSPRYILPVSNSKAYVSDLSSNKISIVDLNTNTIKGNISCPGWSEEMMMIYNKVFVCNRTRSNLYVINTINDVIEDSIAVHYGAGSIVLDKFDRLWITSSGKAANSIVPALQCIDPLTKQVLSTFTFNMNDSPSNLCLNKTKDTLYFLKNGIYRMSILASSAPTVPFIESGSKVFYGLGVSPHDYRVYASDALDYIQQSNIYIFDQNAQQKGMFKAGINANGFYFE